MYSNVLYENSSGWSSGSITLSDSLDNYDFIEIRLTQNGWNNSCITEIKFIDEINISPKILLGGYSNSYVYLIKTSGT